MLMTTSEHEENGNGGTVVEIEDYDSWPHDFRQTVSQKEHLILSFHRERKRINALCEDDVILRCCPPTNVYEADYKQLVADLDGILSTRSIIGYHCTRLTPFEITSIKDVGLRALCPSRIQERINQAFKDKWLTQGEYDHLQMSPTIQDNLENKNGHRTGKIWLCPNRSTLRDSGAVHRLFRSWGGEAIFKGQADPMIMDALSKIGLPCIVKCNVSFPDINSFHASHAERFVSKFVSRSIKYPHPSPAFDMSIGRDLKTDEVLDIIDISNPAFAKLTEYETWTEHHRIM